MLTLTQPRPHTRLLRNVEPATLTTPPAVTGASGTDPGIPVAFTGDWLAEGCPCHTYREGYAGILTRRWNGWAVFTVTRPVAEAIVRRHQTDFTNTMRQHTTGRGGDLAEAWLATLPSMASVTRLGDMIVVDSRVIHDDETAVEIAAPSPDGRYTIGWSWMWHDVDTADIHTVHTGHIR